MRPHFLVLMGDYLLQLRGKSHILVLFIFRLIRFLLEVDRRVPGISTFGGLVIGSAVLKSKEVNMQMDENG